MPIPARLGPFHMPLEILHILMRQFCRLFQVDRGHFITNREFSACRPNEKWLTDVTELKYGVGGKAYLSAILDLCGRNIVAFSLGHSNNNVLVFESFDQALRQYPDAKPLLHSDRGTQYTSRSFRQWMKRAGIQQSMSRVGCCLDNAPMEGFWGILKSEMYYPNRFDDYDSLYEAVSEYINFYNHGRYQKKLGCMTPAEFILSTTGADHNQPAFT